MKKIKSSLLVGAFALVLVGAGCSSTTPSGETSSTGGSNKVASSDTKCGPLKVTIDGQDVTGDYPNGLAHTILNQGYRIEMVTMYTNAYTCEDVLGQGRIDTNNPSWLQASYNEQGQMIALNENNWAFPTTMGTKASAVGETQSICVDNAQLTGLAGGKFEGKKIVINGALSGKYCGEKQQ